MAKSTAFKAAGFGAIGATAQFLTEPKDKLEESAIGFGVGAGIYLGAKGLFALFRKPPDPMIGKAERTLENALDTAHTYNSKLASAVVPMVTRLRNFLPEPNQRLKVFHYIQGTKVNKKLEFDLNGSVITKAQLTRSERAAVESIRRVLDDLYAVTKDISDRGQGNIINAYRTNYLPLIWAQFKKEPLVFTKEFNEKVTGMSGRFKFGQKR